MIKGFGKDVLIYLIGNLAQRAVSFFLLPLYTRSLSVSDYGLVETIMITIQVLVFLMDLGMSRSILRYFARYREDPSQLSSMFTTALSIMLGSMASFLCLGLVLRNALAGVVFGDTQYGTIMAWTLVVSVASTFLQWIYILFRAQIKSTRYVVVSIVNLVTLTGLNILFVRFMNMGVDGVLLAEGAASIVISLFFVPEIFRLSAGKFRPTWLMAKQLFNFGFPLIFSMSGMLIINTFDRYFLVHYRGLGEVGIYSFAVRVAAMLNMVIVAPFQLAWGPYLFFKEKEEIGRFASQIFTYLLLVLGIISTLFMIFSREIILFLGSPKYLASQFIIPYMLVSIILVSIYYWAGGLIHLVEKTWNVGAIVFVAGAANILLNIFLTPQFGWSGAAWSNVLARALAALLTLVVAIRYKPITFEYKRLLLITSATVALWTFYFLTLNSISGWLGFGLRVLVMLVALLLAAIFIPTQQEKTQLLHLLSTVRSRLARLPHENS